MHGSERFISPVLPSYVHYNFKLYNKFKRYGLFEANIPGVNAFSGYFLCVPFKKVSRLSEFASFSVK